MFYALKVIDERIQRRKEQKLKNGATSGVTEIYSSSNRRIQAFLDLLLEEYDEGNITREGVREEVDTFMFEVKTTETHKSSSLSSSSSSLSLNSYSFSGP